MHRVKKFDSEDNLHQNVADYLRLQYPHVIFRTDFAAGIKMTIGQAVRHKRLQGAQRAYPDLFIAHPRYRNRVADYYGLFIELKAAGTRVKKKDGSYYAGHIAEQGTVIDKLSSLGYKAVFACGFDEAKKVIDSYLKEEKGTASKGYNTEEIL